MRGEESSRGQDARGCLLWWSTPLSSCGGPGAGEELEVRVLRVAVSAALDDPRFPPVTRAAEVLPGAAWPGLLAVCLDADKNHGS